ncbi:MAG TPA: carboxypeptidase-like regulatory domain-containing protein [Candidatus Sulfotelmatobacter sp.]|nr:carboxypeptidase-like regulatory domain-containing protein [Candidatus Sulfotelmatobacter sp.]
MKRKILKGLIWISALMLPIACAGAGVGGSIAGTVKDSTGAVIAGASITATHCETKVRTSEVSDSRGSYAFPVLPVGCYDVEVAQPGFRPYRRTGVAVDTDAAIVINVTLQPGERTDSVTVIEGAVAAETVSSQMGEVISSKQITSVPLDGRSYTDLLALQPGVVPETSITAGTVQDVGASALSPSGDLNPGTISINGQREFANAFMVNGSDVEEDVNMGAAIIPNLDSIAEFRILTNNFDAEYGEFSGGQINVITKSGTNRFHGNVFEFLRNTNLDARNYFSPTRGSFDQNQFGGTFGGPIRKNKTFFFADYQGTRLTQGVDTGQIPVPSVADRGGNLADLAGFFTTTGTNGNTVPTTVSGPYWAGGLSQRLGYTVSAGEPYYFSSGESEAANPSATYTSNCTSTAQCVLPTLTIPAAAWPAPATNLLKYIPAPNNADGTFSTSAFTQTLRDDKGSYRLDANTCWGMLSVYYFLDDFAQNNPYPVAQGGASVPGFQAKNFGRAQLLGLSDLKTVDDNAVNEFHVSYLRDHTVLGLPEGGLGISLASQGFVTASGAPSIVALSPQTEGVESVVFNNFSIGTNTNELTQANNTYQVLDNFSKLVRSHTFKAGVELHYDQVNTNPIAQFNGSFLFSGSETGLDFADFLLGIPSQYNQSQLNPFYGRNRYAGVYAQDSWHAWPSLTLNYGGRWDRIEPWYEKYNQISTFAPGRQSVVFPGAPAGILYPTDPGVRRTLAPPGNEFAPRVGLAYSPQADADSVFGKITGGPGKTSIRTGFGMFYTAIEALTIGVLAANAPYGTTYSSPAPPLFNNPFITASSGQNLGQYFPVTLAPLNSSASHPDDNVNWSQYEPISGIPGYPTSNRIPYTEEYMFSLEREVAANTLVSASYVGTQAHRLLVLKEANAGDPALCLSLSQPSQVAAGSPTCGPFGESNVFVTAAGQTIYGTRGRLGSNFGSNTDQSTIGNSNYNAFEVSLRHASGPLQLFAGYTYSKSLDQSSNLGEEVNPLNPALSRALSAFDVRHNFVVSYSYTLPLARAFGANRWTEGWTVSGITRFSSGFPVTLFNYGDNSLLGAEPNGVNNYGVDEPQYTPGPLNLNRNPRNGRPYFNTSLFGLQPLGEPGNAKRRFFSGPGIDNYDMALVKNLSLVEGKSLEFRWEAFNVFNHAQFYGPAAVDGNINGSTFGQVVSAAPPRLMQFAVKFAF